ncbi:MAG: PilN domain-containing protein [Lamprobacter sp.]|uniref:PilN domain-containing protein n=1 Tax=Lamprobacter sp. TaxID=3100796 RepID=UPI002B256CA8|nr:PilN domain-containing protein [Lamprobacter sp.]MEA3638346.1 PilN domain-containing protein [Lamprobacter sp.]
MAIADALTGIRSSLLTSARFDARLEHWRLQFLSCLPRRLSLWLAARHPDLVVVIQGEDAQIFRDVMGERQLLERLSLQPASLPAVEQRMESKESWRQRMLELPAEILLSRRLVLPAKVRDHLHQVITYELDRLTPFSASEVYFDARVVATMGHGSKIEVELALCPREPVDAWLKRLHAQGLPISKLTWPGAWLQANLLPASARPRRWRWSSLILGLLILLILALLAAILVTPLWQKGKYQDQVIRELRAVSLQAQEVETVREALERARHGSVAVIERKREHPRMTDLLLELTQLLPDGTWVQTLNYRDGEVDIRGESTQATALIGILERGPGISNVSFRSPVMQVATSGSDRFHVAFTYQGEVHANPADRQAKDQPRDQQ